MDVVGSMQRPCRRGLLVSLAVAAAAVVAARLMGWGGFSAGLRLFLPEELARYRGGAGDPGLYLALLGRVYDVSSGRRHYEPGAHYSGFAGIEESSGLALLRGLWPPAQLRAFLYSSVSPPSTFVLLSWPTGLDFTTLWCPAGRDFGQLCSTCTPLSTAFRDLCLSHASCVSQPLT